VSALYDSRVSITIENVHRDTKSIEYQSMMAQDRVFRWSRIVFREEGIRKDRQGSLGMSLYLLQYLMHCLTLASRVSISCFTTILQRAVWRSSESVFRFVARKGDVACMYFARVWKNQNFAYLTHNPLNLNGPASARRCESRRQRAASPPPLSFEDPALNS
jgi:hypothetical protein